MKDKMQKMMDMMESKKPSKMSEQDIQAKKDVLKELLQMADEALRGKSSKGLDELKGMKVSVMAKDPKSLKEGLEKAEELVEGQEEMESEEESEDSGMGEDMLESMSEEKSEEPMMMAEEDEDEGLFSKRRKKS